MCNMATLEDLYRYLEVDGFDREYVNRMVFPDWVCQEYFDECEGAIITAVSYCARRLGYDFGQLMDNINTFSDNKI